MSFSLRSAMLLANIKPGTGIPKLSSIGAGSAPELLPKSSGEMALVKESRVQSNARQRLIASAKKIHRSLQATTHTVFRGAAAQVFPKTSREVNRMYVQFLGDVCDR